VAGPGDHRGDSRPQEEVLLNAFDVGVRGMAESTVLQAQPRDQKGKQAAKRLRREGLLPAVVYGENEGAVNCTVEQRAFATLVHEKGRNVIIDLEVEGSGRHATLIKEIQSDPMLGKILHVDFHRISLTEKIIVSVPVEAEGIPLGVRNDGGVLEHLLYEIEVECLPTEIPEQVSYDVTEMGIHDTIHVSDLDVEGNVEITTESDRTVFMVVPPTVRREDLEDEEEALEGEGEEEELQEPEVIERGKRDEEEEEDA